MAISGLLDIDSPGFSFDHDQQHRNMVYSTPASLSWSTALYLLDPMQNANIPSGFFNTLHAQAHADFATAHPSIYWPSTVGINDINLDSGATNWWAFSNWNLHNIANSVSPDQP